MAFSASSFNGQQLYDLFFFGKHKGFVRRQIDDPLIMKIAQYKIMNCQLNKVM